MIEDDIRALVANVNLETRLDDTYWNQLAAGLASQQFQLNDRLPKLWAQTKWSDFPAVDSTLFKRNRLVVYSNRPDAVFMSAHEPFSKYYVRDIKFHDQLVSRVFDYFVPPVEDGFHLMAMPTSTQWRYSAPARMFSRRIAGTPFDSAVTYSSGTNFHVDMDAVERHLDEVVASGQPTHIFTTTIGLLFILGGLENRFKNYVLPEGSCVVHTGGLKGMASRVGLDRLPFHTAEIIGVPPWAVVSAYSVCELPTVFFTPNYRLSRNNNAVPSIAANHHQMPPWTRAVIDKGRIAIFDLAAMDTAAFVLTPDEGDVEKQFIRLEH